MDQSLLRANISSASQETSRNSCCWMVHYRVHKSQLPQSDHSNSRLPPCSLNIFLIFFFHPLLGLPSGLFNSGLPSKTLYPSFLPPIRVTCSSCLILLYLITRVIFGEEYRSQSSSLCSPLHSSVTLSLFCPNTFLSNLFSNISRLCSLSVRKFHAHTKQY